MNRLSSRDVVARSSRAARPPRNLRGWITWHPFQSQEIRDFIVDHFSTATGKDTWVASLTLDGVPLAAAFGFASRKEWLLYQMSMDTDRGAQCSPGNQLLLNLISNCIEAGVRTPRSVLGR